MKGPKIIDINEKKVALFVEERRPSKEIREQLDLGYSYSNGTIELYEIRPVWTEPDKKQNISFAKVKFVKSQQIWKLYWMRASGKWELYAPFPESNYLEEMLKCIDEDANACFKG